MFGLRLSTRITIATIALVVAGAMALIFIEEARLRDVYLSGQRAGLEKNLHTGKLRLGQAINTLRQDVLFLSNTPPVSGIVRAALNRGYDARDSETREEWEMRLQQIFSAFSTAHPDYYQIRYIGVAGGGRELVRIDNRGGKIEIMPPSMLQAKGDRDYFKAALELHAGEVYLSEFNLNQERGVIERPYQPTLRVATPVFTPSGQIFGMVVINMDVRPLLESTTLGLPAGVQAYVTNMNGEYLLHPDTQRSFGSELGSKDNIISDFPSLETMFNLRASEHFLLQAVATKAGTQYLAAERIYFDPGNPARFMVLTYHIPDTVAAQQMVSIPLKNIVGGFVAMLLVSGIALLVLRRTFAPLKRITTAAREIAAGNRHIRLAETGGGEIGELANALNGMLDRLSDSDLIERESAFRKSIIETTHDGFWLVDTRGNLLEANQAYADISGYTVDELAGMHVSQLEAKEQSIDEVGAHITKIIAEGYDVFETRHRHKDGHEIDIEVSTTFMRDSQLFVVFCRDITGRKRSEEELCIAAAAFETQDAIMITDAGGNIIRINHAFSAITGYSPEEVLGKKQGAMNSGQGGQGSCIDALQQSIRDGSWAGEVFDQRKNGQIYPKWMTVTAIKNERQETTHHVSIFSDITARKQVEEARLRENEERFRGTLEQATVGIVHASLDGCFMQVNRKFCEITGYARDELIHKHFRDITFPADLDENIRCIQQLLAGEIPTFSMEKRYVRKDQSLVWVNLTVSLLRDADGIPKYTIGVIEDITGRKQAERDILESYEQLRGLSAHLQVVREEERIIIAREVHDELGQVLTALRMKIAMLRMQAGANDPVLTGQVQDMVQLVDRAIQGVRDVAASLRPSALDMGIVSALEWLCNDFTAHNGIPCTLHEADIEIELDELRAVAVFRVVQEALTNVVRHAGAGRVEVELKQMNGCVSVVVRDNGRGFDPSAHAHKKTFGLLGMSERAIALGGKIAINSTPGHGTEISILLPPPPRKMRLG